MVQLSRSFILPYLKLYNPKAQEDIVETYMGDAHYQGDESMDKYFYIRLPVESEYMQVFTDNPNFIDSYYINSEELMLVFSYPELFRHSILPEFLAGRYSRIPSWYVQENFYPYDATGKRSLNYRILMKDRELEEYWKERLGVKELPENGEVWSKPIALHEVYGKGENAWLESTDEGHGNT